MNTTPTVKDFTYAIAGFEDSRLFPWLKKQPQTLSAFEAFQKLIPSLQEDLLHWLGLDPLVKASQHYPKFDAADGHVMAYPIWNLIIEEIRPHFEARIQELLK